LTTAFNNAAGRTNPKAVPADIGGMVLGPGVYKAPVSLAITGNVTPDGQNNPNSVFIFQMASTLTTAVNSTVTLINHANACNIFWEVGRFGNPQHGLRLQRNHFGASIDLTRHRRVGERQSLGADGCRNTTH